MAQFFESLLDLAMKQGKQILQQAAARQADATAYHTMQEGDKIKTELPYLPEYYRGRNMNQFAEVPLKEAQTRHFDADTSLTPYRARELMSNAALHSIQAQLAPAELTVKQQNSLTSALNAAIANRRFSPEAIETLNELRKSQIATAPARALSGYGKQLYEANAVQQNQSPTGLPWNLYGRNADPNSSPGAQPTIPLRPPIQNAAPGGIPVPGANTSSASPQNPFPTEISSQASGLAANKILKDSVPAEVESRLLQATNIEKTISTINPHALAEFVGLVGKGKKTWQQLKSVSGKESPLFDQYNLAINQQIPAFTEQFRSFLKGSIQPVVAEKLEFIANPDNWFSNPKQSLQAFNSLVNILNSEITTYRESLKSTQPYFNASVNIPKATDNPDVDMIAAAIARKGQK